jgi:hypothetical protein
MKKSAIWVATLAMPFGTTLPARGISGDWQGTLKAGPSGTSLLLAIHKTADGKWNATLSGIDHTPDWGAIFRNPA